MRLINIIALMLAMLVLVTPLSFAVSISGYGYGTSQVVDYVKPQDTITLRTQISGIDAGEGEMSYRPLIGSPQTFTCADNICLLTLNQRTFDSRPYEYLTRFDYSGGRQDRTITLYSDVLGAKVTSAYVDQTLVSPDDSVTFTISAHDDACSVAGCLGTCTGIRQINVYQGSITNKVYEIPVLQTNCDETITEVISVSDLNLQEGTNSLIFEAIDTFENVPRDKKTILMNLDSVAPVINDEDFSLVKDGETIEFYKVPVSNVELIFTISESFQSIRADLSDFGLGVVTPTCSQLYCSYDLTTLNLGSVSEGNKNIEILVELTDSLGNKGTQTLRSSVVVDRSGPVVSSVEISDVLVDGLPAFGSGTEIVVEFDDVAGVETTFMDFSSVNPSKSSVRGVCVENVCTFPGVSLVNEGIKTITISTSTEDILGNNLASAYSFNVYADKTIPSLTDIYFVGFEETAIENYPSRGDTLKIVAVLSGEKEIFAFGNFSKISDEGLIEADCDGGEGVSGWSPSSRDYAEQYSRGYGDDGSSSSSSPSSPSSSPVATSDQIVCEWEVEVTSSGSAIDETVKLYFVDPLENIITEEVSIPNIYGVEEEENPNYWTSSVSCSPNRLDRAVGELIEQQMFCSVTLTSLSSQPQTILDIELDDCDADDFLNDAEIGNELTTHPYLKLTFDKDEYEVNSLDVNCSLEISTVTGNNLVSNTEMEYVIIPVTFFNSPFGLPDEALEAEIQGVIDEWVDGGLGQALKWLGLLNDVASTICKTVDTWNNAAAIISIAAGPTPDPWGVPARAAAEVTDTSAWLSKETLTQFCDFVNCRMTNDDTKTGLGGAGQLIGGGVPWRENLQSIMSLGPVGDTLEQTLGVNMDTYFDVKNNVYLSAVTLCVPGLIYNLEKYRQIQCFYGYCLQDLTATGIPAKSCEKQKAYLECKYFVTPAFKLFSIVNLFDDLMETVKSIVSDPFAALGFIANLVCSPSQATWTPCRVVHVITVALDTWENVQEIWGEFEGFSDDYCKELEDSSSSISSSDRGYVG